jgi:hypothetical protein
VAGDLHAFVAARLDDMERVARAARDENDGEGDWSITQHGPDGLSRWPRLLWLNVMDSCDPESMPPAMAEHIALHDPERVLRRIRADRRILDEHASEWRTVEWPHDQNGKGEGLVCRRCQNAECTEWHPAVGEAGVLPEGFVAPYVLAPCRTLRLLALPHADHPGYREEWRP